MKLSIVIVSYNTKDLLLECLESLYKNYNQEFSKGEYEVVIVDNASSDETVSEVTKRFPPVRLIQNNQNYGFAKANNLGVLRSTGDTVLFLNPDTKIPEKTLPVIVDFLNSNSSVGIATCKILLANGEIDDASHRGFPTPWRALTHFCGLGRLFPKSLFFNGYHLGYQHINTTHEIDSCVGAFLMIKRKVGEELNWFDEDYFWYGDDLDLCYRAKKAGHKVMYVPTVSILHYKGAASGIKKHSKHLSHAGSKTKKRATNARFEVMRIFYEKHYMDIYPRWLTYLVFFGISLKQKITEVFV